MYTSFQIYPLQTTPEFTELIVCMNWYFCRLVIAVLSLG